MLHRLDLLIVALAEDSQNDGGDKIQRAATQVEEWVSILIPCNLLILIHLRLRLTSFRTAFPLAEQWNQSTSQYIVNTPPLGCSLMKRCHRQVQRFAIYGHAKAFINREDLSVHIMAFMLEISRTHKSFAVSQPSQPCRSWSSARVRVNPEVMVIDVSSGRHPNMTVLGNRTKNSSITKCIHRAGL